MVAFMIRPISSNRVPDDIHQDDAASLGRREFHERSQTHGRDLVPRHLVVRIDDRCFVGIVDSDRLQPHAAAQEIDGRVVGDAEQPRLRIGNRGSALVGLHGFEQRVLDDVLAVDGGTRHARAIAVKLRPHRLREFFEV